MRWACASTIEPNLPAPISPIRISRPAAARCWSIVERFIGVLPTKVTYALGARRSALTCGLQRKFLRSIYVVVGP